MKNIFLYFEKFIALGLFLCSFLHCAQPTVVATPTAQKKYDIEEYGNLGSEPQPLSMDELRQKCENPSSPGKDSHCYVGSETLEGGILCYPKKAFENALLAFIKQVCDESGNACKDEKIIMGETKAFTFPGYPDQIIYEARNRVLQVTNYDDAAPCQDRVSASN